MDIRWVIAFTLVAYVLQSLLFRRFGLTRLQYERHFSEGAVYCGEKVELIERLENDKWLPVPWLTIESMFPVGLQFRQTRALHGVVGDALQHHQSLFTLAPYTRVIRHHEITCVARGVYGLQEPVLTCGDLLGATSRFVHIPVDSRLIVYPAILSIVDIPLPAHSWQGSITVRRFIMPDPFTHAGTRDYQYGDPLNQIHWSATARQGRLQVHQRDHTADYRLMILLNFEVTNDMWDVVTDEKLIELGLSYAATLSQEAVRLGLQVGFACNGTRSNGVIVQIAPANGQEHLHAVLLAMAELTMRCGCSFYTLLDQEMATISSLTDYLLISAHQSEEILIRTAKLQTAGHSVTWLKLNHNPDSD